MDNNTKLLYDAHQKELAISYGVIETAKFEGKIEGKIETIEFTVYSAFKNNLDVPIIAKITALTEQEVSSILQKNNLL